MAIGEGVFAISGTLNLFWVAVLGRVIFGLGGETLVGEALFNNHLFCKKYLKSM